MVYDKVDVKNMHSIVEKKILYIIEEYVRERGLKEDAKEIKQSTGYMYI